MTAETAGAATPGVTASTATSVAKYAYDDTGRLRETWAPGSPRR
ncbi:hypothetical protein [Streptomyces sp. NPDC088794]